MLKIVPSNRFKRDLKATIKRGYDLAHLEAVVDTLASGLPLEKKHQDHALTGNFAAFRECHIEPDWLLVYQIHSSELELFLFRTGTHSDLF